MRLRKSPTLSPGRRGGGELSAWGNHPRTRQEARRRQSAKRSSRRRSAHWRSGYVERSAAAKPPSRRRPGVTEDVARCVLRVVEPARSRRGGDACGPVTRRPSRVAVLERRSPQSAFERRKRRRVVFEIHGAVAEEHTGELSRSSFMTRSAGRSGSLRRAMPDVARLLARFRSRGMEHTRPNASTDNNSVAPDAPTRAQHSPRPRARAPLRADEGRLSSARPSQQDVDATPPTIARRSKRAQGNTAPGSAKSLGGSRWTLVGAVEFGLVRVQRTPAIAAGGGLRVDRSQARLLIRESIIPLLATPSPRPALAKSAVRRRGMVEMSGLCNASEARRPGSA